MKVRTLTSLLLTGAVLTCSQSAFAKADRHDAEVQEVIEELRAKLNQLGKMHETDVNSDETVVRRGEVIAPVVETEKVEAEQTEVPADSEVRVQDPISLDIPAEPQQSKMHGIIKNYMDAQGSAARMVAEKAIRDEFKIDHKNACFETVKYVQDGGKGQEAKFGTLFSLMDMALRYATKGNKDILKGIREGIQMREKDERGVYFKQKVKFTPEMLCTK